jgi:hypothetical protein
MHKRAESVRTARSLHDSYAALLSRESPLQALAVYRSPPELTATVATAPRSLIDRAPVRSGNTAVRALLPPNGRSGSPASQAINRRGNLEMNHTAAVLCGQLAREIRCLVHQALPQSIACSAKLHSGATPFDPSGGVRGNTMASWRLLRTCERTSGRRGCCRHRLSRLSLRSESEPSIASGSGSVRGGRP